MGDRLASRLFAAAWEPPCRVLVWSLCVVSASLGCDDATTEIEPAGDAGGVGGQAGGGGDGGGGSGAASGSCWSAAASGWGDVAPFDRSLLNGVESGSPAFGEDAMSLYYVARSSLSSPRRIFRATRPTRTDPFVGGELLASWSSVGDVDHPWVAGDELFVNFDHGSGVFELASSRFDGDAWPDPVSLGETVNTGFANSNASATADGLRLVFRHQAEAGMFLLKLQEAVRPSAEQPFASVTEVEIPPIPPDHHLLCPALSPDGTRLFFSTSWPTDISTGLPAGALTIWYAERSSPNDPWQEATHVEAFDEEGFHSCVYASSPDGCEIIFQHFELGPAGTTAFFTARR